MYQFHQEQHAYALQLQGPKLKPVSSSWVMTSPELEGFVKLPHERILHKSPPRTSLEISSKNPFPGAQPFTTRCDNGVVYITNQRVCLAICISRIRHGLTDTIDCLPPSNTHPRASILLFAHLELGRHLHPRAILWS